MLKQCPHCKARGRLLVTRCLARKSVNVPRRVYVCTACGGRCADTPPLCKRADTVAFADDIAPTRQRFTDRNDC